MGIEYTHIDFKGFGGNWSITPKPCDSCKSAASALFCRADSAFLCLTCDSKIHCANKLASRHERVWMCEVCEQAEAVITCKADAAALCVTCDSDIHSANPLASRHERVPIEPLVDSVDSIVKSSSPFNLGSETVGACSFEDTQSPSWTMMNPSLIGSNKIVDEPELNCSTGELLFSEMDSFLEFDYPNPVCLNSGIDSVVPVKAKTVPLSSSINQSYKNCFEIDFSRSKLPSFDYYRRSVTLFSIICLVSRKKRKREFRSINYTTLNFQVSSSSSLDAGVVPDGNSISDISYSFSRDVNQTNFEPSVPVSASASQANQLDRDARVLRYREKRKNRKFQKTIRYASRKAYAETRPRIKGRFVKRNKIGTELVYNS